MLFNSLHFLIFFPLVVTIYFLLPHRYRWALLLASSYYFYMAWKPEYALIVLFSTVVDYFAALKMSQASTRVKKTFYLGVSLLSNLSLLFVFKYYNFFGGLIGLSALDLLLPMGISFYTFQTLSYSIDVYRGVTEPERHFGIFALYVTFFPQLVAGPIERSNRLLPQFYVKHTFDYIRITDGLKKMAWGFFKKIVIADRLAVSVNLIFADPTAYEGLPLVIATLFFAFQIYCDFSGYSDIAIGAAQVMGFDLMENFDKPYYSRSISEFWKRWHISLSTWFRDYVYIPLGGNRVRLSRHVLNLMITFLISGLWHGANWTFLVWGALHGTFLVIEYLVARAFPQKTRHGFTDALKCLWTFFLVNLAWIFFRANTLADALYILSHAGVGIKNWFTLSYLRETIHILGLTKIDLLTIVFSLCVLECVHVIQKRGSVRQYISRLPSPVRTFLYAAFITMILYLRYVGSQQFIYFQF